MYKCNGCGETVSVWIMTRCRKCPGYHKIPVETQMEPIKRKYRCTRGFSGVLRSTVEARQGHYIMACDANEAIAYMTCQFPNETLFTAHEFGAWLASA